MKFIIELDSLTEAAEALDMLSALASYSSGAALASADLGSIVVGEPRKTRGKNKKVDPPAAAAQPEAIGTGTILAPAAADPFLSALLLGAGPSAGTLPPVAQVAAPVVQVAPPVVQAPQPITVMDKAVTQQDLIKGFVQLGQTPGKGPAAMQAVLAKFGVSVVPMIPQARWAEALAEIRAALAS